MILRIDASVARILRVIRAALTAAGFVRKVNIVEPQITRSWKPVVSPIPVPFRFIKVRIGSELHSKCMSTAGSISRGYAG